MKFTPHTPEDIQYLLQKIGVKDVASLFDSIPEELKLRNPLNLPPAFSELEASVELKRLADKNLGTDRLICFAGGGAYDHYIPPVIDAIISRPEFYTAYTPYQAEVSQGTLQVIYEFQSLICRLFEMEVANASMYDCASALAETVHMARDITSRHKILISGTINPRYREVVATYATGLNVPIQTLPYTADLTTDLKALNDAIDNDTAAVLIQHPNFFGYLEPVREIVQTAHEKGALFVCAVDPISLGIITPPGAYNADIAVAEGQCLGIPLYFGGPYLGIFTAQKKYIRHMPGRIAARTTDITGKIGYVLALQTREQHIRRERATSNICTNQALCALIATIYLTWAGREGIKEIAKQCCAKTHYIADAIKHIPGFTLLSDRKFVREFTVKTPVPAREIVKSGIESGILSGVDLGNFNPEWNHWLLITATEKRTRAELDRYIDFLKTFSA
ncbi:aminomethyl-transferring glycine dehydrogenase subunit GcvPA [candidate division WOR-3 bacterium]|nr:aminomethyl-transferring glycine dehydrogenase subunit GcvPA [candidate division WOR-3 bacterium]